MNARGKFIAIDGLDGAGSTTQATILASWLRRGGHKVMLTREPSDGPGGSMLRLALSKCLSIDSRTRALLFAADRMDHLFNRAGIMRFLSNRESVVVSERYLLSFLAYQSFDLGVDFDWLLVVSSRGVMPDLTVFLDVPPEECLARIVVDRGFHQELYETQQQLIAIRERFRGAVQKLQSQGVAVSSVSGVGSVQQVAARVRTAVESMLLPGRAPRSEWRRLLEENPRAAELVAKLEEEGLSNVELRRIQHGIQVLILDGSDIVKANIYDTGRVRLQGPHNNDVTNRVEGIVKNLNSLLAPAAQSMLFPEDGQEPS